MFEYPAEIEAFDDGYFLLTFPDVPYARSQGVTPEEAFNGAANALISGLSVVVDAKRELPKPSERQGRKTVAPNALECAKLALYEALREHGGNKSQLAKQLGWNNPQVDRVLDLFHNSKIEHVETALAALGRSLRVSVVDFQKSA